MGVGVRSIEVHSLGDAPLETQTPKQIAAGFITVHEPGAGEKVDLIELEIPKTHSDLGNDAEPFSRLKCVTHHDALIVEHEQVLEEESAEAEPDAPTALDN